MREPDGCGPRTCRDDQWPVTPRRPPPPAAGPRLRLTERGHELLRTAGTLAHDLDAALPLGDLDTGALRAALLEFARPPGL